MIKTEIDTENPETSIPRKKKIPRIVPPVVRTPMEEKMALENSLLKRLIK